MERSSIPEIKRLNDTPVAENVMMLPFKDARPVSSYYFGAFLGENGCYFRYLNHNLGREVLMKGIINQYSLYPNIPAKPDKNRLRDNNTFHSNAGNIAYFVQGIAFKYLKEDSETNGAVVFVHKNCTLNAD